MKIESKAQIICPMDTVHLEKLKWKKADYERRFEDPGEPWASIKLNEVKLRHNLHKKFRRMLYRYRILCELLMTAPGSRLEVQRVADVIDAEIGECSVPLNEIKEDFDYAVAVIQGFASGNLEIK